MNPTGLAGSVRTVAVRLAPAPGRAGSSHAAPLTPGQHITRPVAQVVGPDSPLPQGKLKDSWRPGLATARAGPLPTWMKAMDLGNRAYRSSSLTVTVTWP